VTPEDSNWDSWFETEDQSPRSVSIESVRYAQLRVTYDGIPTGLTVNIGVPRTNNGGSGDSGTQHNDAEMQIGALLSNSPEFPTLRAFGNDNNPATLAIVASLAALGRTVVLTAGDQFLSCHNGSGVAGLAVSPYLLP
jgi:hypothetical protein